MPIKAAKKKYKDNFQNPYFLLLTLAVLLIFVALLNSFVLEKQTTSATTITGSATIEELLKKLLTVQTPIKECTDSDGGRVYDIKGKVTDKSGSTSEDACLTENILKEDFCGEDDLASSKFQYCPAGCKDGACIVQIEVTCTDSDGKNYYTKGKCIDNVEGTITSPLWDYCDYDATSVLEMLCSDDGICHSELYKCPAGCQDGACKKEPLLIEAEKMHLVPITGKGDVEVKIDSTASNGKYVQTPDKGVTYDCISTDTTSGWAKVTITQPGKYYLEARAIGPTTTDNSLCIKFADEKKYIWHVQVGSTWKWIKLGTRTLDAREYTIRFYVREDGTKLDAIRFVLEEPSEIPGETTAPPTTGISCTDTDKDDIFKKGSVVISGQLNTDYCYDLSPGKVAMADYVVEHTCMNTEMTKVNMVFNGPYNDKKMLQWAIYKCPYGCKDGACLTQSKCTDSDGGIKYYRKGKAELNTGSNMEDSCYSESTLIEVYCKENRQIITTAFPCPAGCANGACKFCTDSDGGNLFEKGTATDSYSRNFEDTCTSTISLREYFCNPSGLLTYEIYPCKCSEGRCTSYFIP